MTDLIKPKEIIIADQEGAERTYVLSRLSATAGREMIVKYPTDLGSLVAKGGAEYAQSEETMLKLMAAVAVVTSDGRQLRLSTKALVDNHVPDWETLVKLEKAQLEYNVSFFGSGLSSAFFASISQKVGPWITQTLTPLLVASLRQEKPPSEN